MAVVGINEGSSKYIHVDSVGTEVYNVTKIDIGAAGASNLFTGTITEVANLAKGTINVATVSGNLGTLSMLNAGTIASVGTIPGVGTLTNVGSITNIGMLHGGTVGSVAGVGGTVAVNVVAGGAGGGVADLQVRNESGTTWADVGYGTSTSGTFNVPIHIRLGTITKLEGGTLGLVTTVTNLSNGTIQNSGTTTGVGVVSMLSAGTLTTIPNIPGGTLGLVTTVTNPKVPPGMLGI